MLQSLPSFISGKNERAHAKLQSCNKIPPNMRIHKYRTFQKWDRTNLVYKGANELRFEDITKWNPIQESEKGLQSRTD